MKKTGAPEDVIYFASSPVSTENETSLIDLWNILARRKWVILAGLLFGITAALASLLFIPEKYRFHTSIVLGQLIINSTNQIEFLPIDTPETVLAKLNEGYIPQIMEQAVKKSGNSKDYKLHAKIPKGSKLVVIEAIGPAKNESIYLQLISDAAHALVKDHDKILTPAKEKLMTELEQAQLEFETIKDDREFTVEMNALKQDMAKAKNKLFALKDHRKIIEARKKHIDIERDLAKKQHQDYKSTLETALKNRAETIKQSNNPATAVTLLMFGSEIQHYQERIATLDQQLQITLPEKLENLQKQLEDNTRAQQQQTDLISNYELEIEKMDLNRKKKESVQLLIIKDIKSRMEEIRPTQILHQAGRSIDPVGIGMTVKIILGLILGLVVGVLGVFVMEFLAKASARST